MKKETFSNRRTEFREKTIAELLKLLESENLQTRFFAEMALRDISGT
jgi:hypothetical protein